MIAELVRVRVSGLRHPATGGWRRAVYGLDLAQDGQSSLLGIDLEPLTAVWSRPRALIVSYDAAPGQVRVKVWLVPEPRGGGADPGQVLRPAQIAAASWHPGAPADWATIHRVLLPRLSNRNWPAGRNWLVSAPAAAVPDGTRCQHCQQVFTGDDEVVWHQPDRSDTTQLPVPRHLPGTC